jgi:hypothetical protein
VALVAGGGEASPNLTTSQVGQVDKCYSVEPGRLSAPESVHNVEQNQDVEEKEDTTETEGVELEKIEITASHCAKGFRLRMIVSLRAHRSLRERILCV